jgi:5'-methylthioadenosine phosphorylase
MRVLPHERAADLGAEVGIFGGSGFYDFVDDAVDVEIDTPFGPAASLVRIGTVAGRRVAFLARHGREHHFAAHRVPFRANVWAMASLGVRSIIGPCSVGSLQPHLEVGDFVVVDQLVDRTQGRASTFHDAGAGDGRPGSNGPVHHQPFADPYDSGLRRALVAAGPSVAGVRVHDRGTMVVIEGPRFSTRAESQWFGRMGWDVVNMTGHPEAVLAAEVGMPYATVALVTDRDAGGSPDAGTDGAGGDAPVTMEKVMAVVSENVGHVKHLLTAALPDLP